MESISITRPRGFKGHCRPRVVVQSMQGLIRLHHASSQRQAAQVRDAWIAGDFSKWPGEVRVFNERRSR